MNFDCSEKGIEVQCMDSSHVALVGLLLRECAFSELLGQRIRGSIVSDQCNYVLFF